MGEGGGGGSKVGVSDGESRVCRKCCVVMLRLQSKRLMLPFVVIDAACVPWTDDLTDVVVSHSLTANAIARSRDSAADAQRLKNGKYAGVASRLGAELLNVSVDAYGGVASDTLRLARAVGEEGERCSIGSASSVVRRLLGL